MPPTPVREPVVAEGRYLVRTQTLDAVDEYEPGYQKLIRSPRPQGPAALLAAMGFDAPDGAPASEVCSASTSSQPMSIERTRTTPKSSSSSMPIVGSTVRVSSSIS